MAIWIPESKVDDFQKGKIAYRSRTLQLGYSGGVNVTSGILDYSESFAALTDNDATNRELEQDPIVNWNRTQS